MSVISLPEPIRMAKARGHLVFGRSRSANLIVIRGPGGPGDWDGLCTLSWVDGPGWVSHAWPCATRPGIPYLQAPINPLGTAMLQPGQHRLSHAIGLHRGMPALVQVAPSLPVLRDPDRDAHHEPSLPSTGTGLNVHRVSSPSALAGCVGLLGAHTEQLIAACRLLAGTEYQGDRFTLTLIEA